MNREFLEAQGLAPEAVEAVLAEHERLVQQLQAQHAEAQFAGVLENMIQAHRGRSAKAIMALLDVEAIRAGDDPRAAAEEALTALKKESPYLFEASAPAYAANTGTGNFVAPAPRTLADALKEKFGK